LSRGAIFQSLERGGPESAAALYAGVVHARWLQSMDKQADVIVRVTAKPRACSCQRPTRKGLPIGQFLRPRGRDAVNAQQSRLVDRVIKDEIRPIDERLTLEMMK
jgi:hypothetical protein